MGPGLLATILSSAAFYHSFLLPLTPSPQSRKRGARFLAFAASALIVGLLSAAQRRATESLRRTRDVSRETVQELPKTNEALGTSEALLTKHRH